MNKHDICSVCQLNNFIVLLWSRQWCGNDFVAISRWLSFFQPNVQFRLKLSWSLPGQDFVRVANNNFSQEVSFFFSFKWKILKKGYYTLSIVNDDASCFIGEGATRQCLIQCRLSLHTLWWRTCSQPDNLEYGISVGAHFRISSSAHRGTTSNGSWCIGIKGEMSDTVFVTFTWDMYIYMSCL